MSYKAVDWAIRVAQDANLEAKPAYLLIALAHHHNPANGCFPSQSTLCKRLRVTERHLRRTLTTLVKAGLVRVQKRGLLNLYDLNFEWKQRTQMSGESENIFTTTGHPCPVCTGHTGPLFDKTTGHPCPVITSNPEEDLISKWKVPEAALTGTKDPPETSHPDSEEEPEPTPEDPDAMKVDDVLKTQMAPKTLPAILKIYSDAKAKKLAVTGGTLGRIWKALHELYLPGYKSTLLTQAAMGQLKQAHDLADSPDFVFALAHVIEHWDAFLTFLRNDYDVSFPSIPMVPSVGIVLKHIQPVMQFHQDVKPQAKMTLVIPKSQQKLSLTKKVAYHAPGKTAADGK